MRWTEARQKMVIPIIQGIIDRRILINYQLEEDVLNHYLPEPFRPKLVNGKGMAGICLIRLKQVRPKGLPHFVGISSENGAHRIAVEWMENGATKEGVYIPRRDTSSRLKSLAGGKLFPGVHHLAQFTVREINDRYTVEFTSDDGTFLSITAQETTDWNAESVFDNLDCASNFFENGAVGYSPSRSGIEFDGLELKTYRWKVKPLHVSKVCSSFFENTAIFPKDTIKFDNALLMKNIEHEWRSLKEIKGYTRTIL